ncbi:MAG TPA: hypothetical protein VFX79_00005, partial [Candidatus Saccharimonadales bacterium]|nr:hypothetical protein [Candidatus Saccharimonadales bacterium]
GKERVKRVAAIGAMVGTAALVAAGCGDDNEGIHSKKEAKAFAVKDYDLTFDKAKTPVDRFVLQYLVRSQIDILDKNAGDEGGPNKYHRFVFGNACLQNTSYDIAGGRIRGTFGGFLSGGSINGRVPTAGAEAYVDHRNPDMLTIQSGNAESHDLRFTGAQGEESHLTPADQQTENVVDLTNGCIPAGEFGYTHADMFAGSTSPFIVRTEGDMARPQR